MRDKYIYPLDVISFTGVKLRIRIRENTRGPCEYSTGKFFFEFQPASFLSRSDLREEPDPTFEKKNLISHISFFSLQIKANEYCKKIDYRGILNHYVQAGFGPDQIYKTGPLFLKPDPDPTML